jgi:hypothetical protein
VKVAILVLLTVAFSYSYADQIIDTVEENLSKYDVCTGERYNQKEMDSFKKMLEDFKMQTTEKTLEITDFSFDRTTITNTNTKKECTLVVDVYEGRCLYAFCN